MLVRARNHVYSHQFADAACAAATLASVAAFFFTAPTSPRTHDRDVAGSDVFLADQNHVSGSLDHRVGGFGSNPTRPFVSIIPKASLAMHSSFTTRAQHHCLKKGKTPPVPAGLWRVEISTLAYREAQGRPR